MDYQYWHLLWLTDWLSICTLTMIDWLTIYTLARNDWLTIYLPTALAMIDWLTIYLHTGNDWLIDYLSKNWQWLTDWLSIYTLSMIDWLTIYLSTHWPWLADWLIDCDVCAVASCILEKDPRNVKFGPIERSDCPNKRKGKNVRRTIWLSTQY